VRVAVLVPDLLFGSRALEIVQAAGYDGVLVVDVDQLSEVDAEDPVGAIVADLSSDGVARAEELADVRPPGVPVLACFAHVEPEVRTVALEAGLEQVVPRSRFVREGGELLKALLAD
jgi:hypothetical protein